MNHGHWSALWKNWRAKVHGQESGEREVQYQDNGRSMVRARPGEWLGHGPRSGRTGGPWSKIRRKGGPWSKIRRKEAHDPRSGEREAHDPRSGEREVHDLRTDHCHIFFRLLI